MNGNWETIFASRVSHLFSQWVHCMLFHSMFCLIWTECEGFKWTIIIHWQSGVPSVFNSIYMITQCLTHKNNTLTHTHACSHADWIIHTPSKYMDMIFFRCDISHKRHIHTPHLYLTYLSMRCTDCSHFCLY